MSWIFEFYRLVLDSLGISPADALKFITHNATWLWVLLALSTAATVSTLTSRIFGFYLRDMVYLALRFLYYTPLRFFKGKTILLLCDADEHAVIAKNFARHLRSALKTKGVRSRIVTLSSGSAILGYPLHPILIRSVILIITDVTPLSVEPKRRKLVQQSLTKYTDSGGILILFHDVLYRRTQNIMLQDFAGGKLTHFTATPIVNYIKYTGIQHAPRNATLMLELPSSFALSDKELIEGEWDESVEFIYVKDGTTDVPLVTRRVCGEGVVYWLNSGDTSRTGPAGSIAIPESPLICVTEKLIRLGRV